MEPRDKSPMEPRDKSPSPKTQPNKKGVTLVGDRPVTDRTREGYFGERRVSMAESVRRQSWFDQARINSQAPRRRGMLLHEVRFPATFNGLYCARFSPGGDLLATSFGVGAIQIRSPETGKLIGTLRSGLDQGLPIMSMRFHPVHKHKFYAASACGNVFLCDSSAGEFSKFVEEKNNEVNAVDVDRTGTLVATAGKDAVVRLYDSASNKRKHEYRKAEISLRNEDAAKFHHMRVYALRFHPNMTDILVTGSWDNSVKIWDVRVPVGCVKTIVGPHICGDAVDIRDNVILTGSWVVHSSLQTWDLRTGKLLDTIVPSNRPASLDGDFLYAVNYFDGDPYKDMVLAGGSGTGALEVISLKEKKVLGSFPVNKAIQAIDSYGKTIAFGGMESLLRIADFV